MYTTITFRSGGALFDAVHLLISSCQVWRVGDTAFLPPDTNKLLVPHPFPNGKVHVNFIFISTKLVDQYPYYCPTKCIISWLTRLIYGSASRFLQGAKQAHVSASLSGEETQYRTSSRKRRMENGRSWCFSVRPSLCMHQHHNRALLLLLLP
jgi:hypothetical protein